MEGQSATNTSQTEIATDDSATDYNVQNLWPDFTVTIKVAAVTEKGVGDISSSVEATTQVGSELCTIRTTLQI